MAKKILLIESDTALAGTIAAALHARGADIAVARDAGSALDVARAERPDGIVVSAELAGGSGFVVCNKLRKEPDLREVPLLLTSASATDETFEQHRKLKTRADGYLKKPFAVSALLELLAPLAGLTDPSPGAPDDDDLSAFDAAFDSIAQVGEASAPIDHAISSEEVDAAAALVADLPDVEEPPAFAPAAGAAPAAPLPQPPQPPQAAVAPAPQDGELRAELDRARAELAEVRAELADVRAELDAANAARAELTARLDAEAARTRDAEAKVGEELAAVRAVLSSALAALDRS
jgi:CheY-like chemotaxis protein